MITSKTKAYFSTKIEQLNNKKYSILVLGDEGKKEVAIETRKDMEKFAEVSSDEADRILKYNSRYENVIFGMIVVLFFLALAFIILGAIYWNRTGTVVTSGGIITGLGISITWPIKQLLKLRESNISLQLFSLTLPKLPPEEVVKYLKTFVSFA